MALASTAGSALQAAGFVGTWDTDVRAGLSVLDPGAATVLAGHPSLAGRPLPMEVALGRVHPEDRAWVFETIRRARQAGGPFSAEFRVLSEAGDVRWILNRGHLATDATGTRHGRGAYIDVTDLYAGAPPPRDAAGPAQATPERASPLDAPDPQARHLETAADLCLRVHAAIERHGDAQLQLISGILLLEIGRALARHDPS